MTLFFSASLLVFFRGCDSVFSIDVLDFNFYCYSRDLSFDSDLLDDGFFHLILNSFFRGNCWLAIFSEMQANFVILVCFSHANSNLPLFYFVENRCACFYCDLIVLQRNSIRDFTGFRNVSESSETFFSDWVCLKKH